jgi:Putative amidase domain
MSIRVCIQLTSKRTQGMLGAFLAPVGCRRCIEEEQGTMSTVTVMARRYLRRLLPAFGALALFFALGIGVVPAYAYNGGTAANYADQYWQNYNSNYPDFSSTLDDCTNFVSQSLHQGGFSYIGFEQNPTDDHNWWVNRNPWQILHPPRGWDWAHSWSVAPENYNFLMWTYPGGWNWGTTSGTTNSAPPNGLYRGDVLYYDWGDGHGRSHAAIQTYIQGTDPTTGWFGDLVDAHTTNHYHAIWTLEPYNAKASTTTITLVHVDANNN